MGKTKKEKVLKLNKKNLKEIDYLEKDYRYFVSTFNEEETEFYDASKEEIIELNSLRKGRKYAAFTVELFAILEQYLRDLYSIYNVGNDYDGNNKKGNIILKLEDELKKHIEFKNNTKRLADLRKNIVHYNFSLKKARKKLGLDIKNKELFEEELNRAKDYIISIKIK